MEKTIVCVINEYYERYSPSHNISLKSKTLLCLIVWLILFVVVLFKFVNTNTFYEPINFTIIIFTEIITLYNFNLVIVEIENNIIEKNKQNMHLISCLPISKRGTMLLKLKENWFIKNVGAKSDYLKFIKDIEQIIQINQDNKGLVDSTSDKFKDFLYSKDAKPRYLALTISLFTLSTTLLIYSSENKNFFYIIDMINTWERFFTFLFFDFFLSISLFFAILIFQYSWVLLKGLGLYILEVILAHKKISASHYIFNERKAKFLINDIKNFAVFSKSD